MGDRPSRAWPQFVPVADHALLVELGDEIDDETSARVVALDRAIVTGSIDGVIEVVPAYVNVLVDFDPIVTDHDEVEQAVRRLLSTATASERSPIVRTIEVCYEAPFAPDLGTVADTCGLSIEATIAAHLAGDYRVAMYGFAPGCAYLAGVPEPIRVPRKPAPVRGISAGSVIIAGPQCMVTTIDTPTGWSIIGRSPSRILLDDPAHPFLFDVGDRVAFARIDLATFEQRTSANDRGQSGSQHRGRST